MYFTDEVIDGQFIVLARTNGTGNYAPTYGISTPFWDETKLYYGEEAQFNFLPVEVQVLSFEPLEV